MPLNTPDEVAILIGVALTEQGFLDRVKTSDWLSRFCDPEAAANYWLDVYQPLVVDPIEELIATAQSLRARIEAATLEALREVTLHSRVVVVLAHWRDSPIEREDIFSEGSEAWGERAAAEGSALARWITDRLGHSPIEEILNESLHAELPPENTSQTRVVESARVRASRRRDELDRIFVGMLRPGNRLELLDGLHPKEAVESAIAVDFEGVLDFTSCTSTYLADYVSRARKRKIRIVEAPNPIEFVASAPIIATTLELLSEGLFSYQEAATEAKRLWEEAVCRR
jgi:hypothetical protein